MVACYASPKPILSLDIFLITFRLFRILCYSLHIFSRNSIGRGWLKRVRTVNGKDFEQRRCPTVYNLMVLDCGGWLKRVRSVYGEDIGHRRCRTFLEFNCSVILASEKPNWVSINCKNKKQFFARSFGVHRGWPVRAKKQFQKTTAVFHF